jgi:hypothetical protein
MKSGSSAAYYSVQEMLSFCLLYDIYRDVMRMGSGWTGPGLCINDVMQSSFVTRVPPLSTASIKK